MHIHTERCPFAVSVSWHAEEGYPAAGQSEHCMLTEGHGGIHLLAFAIYADPKSSLRPMPQTKNVQGI